MWVQQECQAPAPTSAVPWPPPVSPAAHQPFLDCTGGRQGPAVIQPAFSPIVPAPLQGQDPSLLPHILHMAMQRRGCLALADNDSPVCPPRVWAPGMACNSSLSWGNGLPWEGQGWVLFGQQCSTPGPSESSVRGRSKSHGSVYTQTYFLGWLAGPQMPTGSRTVVEGSEFKFLCC